MSGTDQLTRQYIQAFTLAALTNLDLKERMTMNVMYYSIDI